MKKCKSCRAIKSLEKFYFKPSGKFERDAHCIECRKCIRNSRNSKDICLRLAYGITIDTYEKMHAEQQGKCAICFHQPNENAIGPQRLHVDHNHTTGNVRGLLCKKCNTMIALAQEDKEILLRAVSYLDRIGIKPEIEPRSKRAPHSLPRKIYDSFPKVAQDGSTP